jgi:hypothetical protein
MLGGITMLPGGDLGEPGLLKSSGKAGSWGSQARMSRAGPPWAVRRRLSSTQRFLVVAAALLLFPILPPVLSEGGVAGLSRDLAGQGQYVKLLLPWPSWSLLTDMPWNGIERVGLLLIRLVMNLLSVCPDYSDAREGIQRLTGHGAEDSRADQFANEWGRSGKDPNHFRPAGLPRKY